MSRFQVLLSGLFLIYLILEGIQKKNFICFYLAAILIIGMAIEYFQLGKTKSLETKEEKPEEGIYISLSHLMKDHSLEMRVRRAPSSWNVTFLRGLNGIIWIVGKGSASTISEAIMRAEDDFEKGKKK